MKILAVCFSLVAALAQTASAPRPAEAIRVRKSADLMPHFESVAGRQGFFVDGRPFTILACESPRWDLVYGRETLNPHVSVRRAKALSEPQRGC